ncbi:MAG TPA: prenyltransferase/squalene oxidase repeat-containing protein [Verrucomicrobiaceae bacterium]|jgi:squalene-hopene/tetraprenyl-beta-curcumene cyclase
MNFSSAIANTRAHLLSLRNAQGHWEGELSSSALSTATAVVALALVDDAAHARLIANGARWLLENQIADGGWGDTTISKSNLSTTLLCWCALKLVASQTFERRGEVGAQGAKIRDATQRVPTADLEKALAPCESWIHARVGSLDPDAICRAVVARYGKDKTFSVPILMTCAIGGRLGPHDEAWRKVLALPFEFAALPRTWFGAIGLPVVSYALPALIAIGHARFYHAPPAWWNPLRWIRGALWPRISPMLRSLQPATGGYLEATPLTSFVTMALAASGERFHPTVAEAVRFLVGSQRRNGSWAIDTNLATWATTLSVKAVYGSTAGTPARSLIDPGGDAASENKADRSVRCTLKQWLLAQQYKIVHPFTNAAPGGWAWTDLPGGVPDADDTCGALIALWHLGESGEERRKLARAVEAGVRWLLDLQNRDGGMPTFCRGWGALPFDRSTPEITAHFLWALSLWQGEFDGAFRCRTDAAQAHALTYLKIHQRGDGAWIPLWFGNEHAPDEENPVHGTAMVLVALSHGAESADQPMLDRAIQFLLGTQGQDGGWGGAMNAPATIEETANAVNALASSISARRISAGLLAEARRAVSNGANWLGKRTRNGASFPAAPIGLYFAKLWYHEKLYPVIWTLDALQQAAMALQMEGDAIVQ